MRRVTASGLLTVACMGSLVLFVGAAHGGPPASGPPAGGGVQATPKPGPGTVVPDQGNEHISTLDTPHPPYNSEPPTSGWHIPFIAKWGVHTQPVPLELQVHNLEDGGVVIQYSCPTPCPDLVKKLDRLATRILDRTEARYHHLIVAPWPPNQRLPFRLALTAWGRIDRLDAYDEARIVRFIEAYIGVDHHKGAQSPAR